MTMHTGITCPEGIPGEPASGENPAIEKKPVVAAVAQPFLTSIDSLGFDDLRRDVPASLPEAGTMTGADT